MKERTAKIFLKSCIRLVLEAYIEGDRNVMESFDGIVWNVNGGLGPLREFPEGELDAKEKFKKEILTGGEYDDGRIMTLAPLTAIRELNRLLRAAPMLRMTSAMELAEAPSRSYQNLVGFAARTDREEPPHSCEVCDGLRMVAGHYREDCDDPPKCPGPWFLPCPKCAPDDYRAASKECSMQETRLWHFRMPHGCMAKAAKEAQNEEK